MKLNILTNSRPTADLGALLTAGVTDGQIKISADFGKLIGVVNGDNMAVGDDAGGLLWAFKGNEDAAGNKLAKSGNYLQMSSKNVWNILGGNTETNRIFEPEGEPVVDEDGTYQQIVFKEETAKVARTSSADKIGESDADQDGSTDQGEEGQEEK